MTAVLQRVYTPRGAARDIFSCRAPEVVLDGPAGTGKSRALLEKLHMMCLVNPGMRALIVRKTAQSLTSTALVTWTQWVVAEALEHGHLDFYGGSAQEPAQYRYLNGSKVMIGGMDKPSKIMSSEYDLIVVLEATELTITDWEALTTRLRNGRVSFQQIIADCNPDAETHWIKQRANAGRLVMLHSRHEDNPRLFDDTGRITDEGVSYLGRLDALTGVRHARLRKGLWVSAEGVIFENYDPPVHLVARPKEPPADWTRYWTVDFGYTHPFVLQCWAIDPDGRAFRYREIYHTGRTVAEHAQTIKKCVLRADGTWREPKPRAIICDHDAEDRATLTRELGLPTTAARKTVSDGIQAVMARLRPAGDGKPRLFLVQDALVERDRSLAESGRPTCTEEEIGGYVWNTTKDAPVKEQDDGCDALRYLVAHLDLKTRSGVRFL